MCGHGAPPPCSSIACAQRLADAGHREIALTGIHLTSYGRDLDGVPLHAVAAAQPGIVRVLRPPSRAWRMMRLHRRWPVWRCPQFHLSLQSGCDSVHTACAGGIPPMNTGGGDYPAAALSAAPSTDIITGFPAKRGGARQSRFRAKSPLRARMFPYSAGGTLAATMPHQVRCVRAARGADDCTGRNRAGLYAEGAGSGAGAV